jgi:hypothetical protein
MTGFGKASLQLPTKKNYSRNKITELKGLDLNTRMPSVFLNGIGFYAISFHKN